MRAVLGLVLVVATTTVHAQPVPKPDPAVPAPSGNTNAAWLLVGGALTFATIGGVFAYSTSSAEQDIKDLYVGFEGIPPRYDATIAAQYQDLVDEGKRYERLAWGSFGLAAGCAIGAGILFWRASREEPAVMPVVSSSGAGVRVRF